MGMSMFAGKTLSYITDDDAIHPDTICDYRDQNGYEVKVSIKKILEKAKKIKSEEMLRLISDIEGDGLFIGFPIIIALNEIAETLGEKEALDCLEKLK